jgi:hypothetical protein
METIDRWASVKLLNDGYTGWIDRKLVNPLSQAEYNKLLASGKTTIVQPYLSIHRDNTLMLIPGGSTVYGSNSNRQFSIGIKTFKLSKPDEMLELSAKMQ